MVQSDLLFLHFIPNDFMTFKTKFFIIVLLPVVSLSYGQVNPIIRGFYADPTILTDGDTTYVYATRDPWGKDDLAVFYTTDLRTWKETTINWPTKKQCTSPTSTGAMVWAPSVVKGMDGKYYMYVSVGSEIWAGDSSHPLGPWDNEKMDGTPLISTQDPEDVHTIDPDCFIDDDGQAWLYWGSGWNWVNGHCMAVKLKPDMITFAGVMHDITPPHYFEGPHMMKRNKVYYLMYSDGKAIDPSYKIRYATSSSPEGPWAEGAFSPILETSSDSTTIGPGHHTTFRFKNQDFILYHRIVPQNREFVLRELCIDRLYFDARGNILKVIPLSPTVRQGR